MVRTQLKPIFSLRKGNIPCFLSKAMTSIRVKHYPRLLGACAYAMGLVILACR